MIIVIFSHKNILNSLFRLEFTIFRTTTNEIQRCYNAVYLMYLHQIK